MSGHTKGPWKVEFGFICDGNGDRLFHQSEMMRNHNITVGEMEANAQLIAAAPDLLEACKEAVKIIKDILPPKGYESYIEQLKQAIAKAEESK